MERPESNGPVGTVSTRTAAPELSQLDAADFADYVRVERDRRLGAERGAAPRGGMYRRAMMRAYAESLGIDHEAALRQRDRAPARPALDPPRPRLDRAPVRRPNRAPTPRPEWRRAGAIGAAVVALTTAWMTLVGPERSGDADGGTAATAAVVLPAGTAPAPPAANHATQTSPPAAPAATSPRAVTNRPATAPARAAAKPPMRATEGTLEVRSDPSGARVTVNGVGWGVTPITIRNLEFGAKRIRLTMQGHISDERVVQLAPDRPTGTVRLRLRQRPDPTRSPSGRTAHDEAARRP